MQPVFEWDRDCALPVSGRSPAARHASASGAQVSVRTRGAVALAYRRLLRDSGPQSDVEAARGLGRLVSSMCSTRAGWGAHIVASGTYEHTSFGTRRVRWQWVE